MLEYSYDIVMQTPLGDKKGRMDLKTSLDRLSGHIYIMGRKNEFAGKVDGQGNCSISGSILSIVSSLDYSAKGRLSKEEIELTLYGRQAVFHIKGRALEDLEEGD